MESILNTATDKEVKKKLVEIHCKSDATIRVKYIYGRLKGELELIVGKINKKEKPKGHIEFCEHQHEDVSAAIEVLKRDYPKLVWTIDKYFGNWHAWEDPEDKAIMWGFVY